LQESLGYTQCAQRPRVKGGRLSFMNGHELQAPATQIQYEAVLNSCGVDRRDVAVARFILGGEDLDWQMRGLRGAPDQLTAVGGVADRAGGDWTDMLSRDS